MERCPRRKRFVFKLTVMGKTVNAVLLFQTHSIRRFDALRHEHCKVSAGNVKGKNACGI